MPRSTSVVPPWMVSLGAIMVAKRSCSSSVARLPSVSSMKAASSRTRFGSFCSHTVPRSFTIEPSTTGSLPACSMPLTDTDMRRSVCSCATRRPSPSALRMSGLSPERAHQLDQHIERLEETLRPAALVGELAGRLLPRPVDLAEHVIVRHEGVLEHDLVEIVLAGELIDRVHRDARRLHVDEELGQPVAAVLLRRRRGAEQGDHVVGDVRVAGPDLGAVDQPAAFRLRRLGLRGEQVGAGVRLAHADREAHLAAADARQDVHLHVLGRVFHQDRAALAVGDEVQAHRRIGDAELLGHHVALEEAALVPAVFLRPGHADPALGADAPAEFLACASRRGPGRVRIERAGRDLVGEERAHLLRAASSHSGGRRIWSKRRARVMRSSGQRAATSGQNSSAPRAAIAVAERRRPVALVAEVVAPGQHAQRVAMQDVLVGEADRAMHLMRDRGAFLRGFGGADLRRRRFEEDRVVECSRRARSRRRPNARRVIAAATSPASRARLCCTAWNFAIGRSKATRSLA